MEHTQRQESGAGGGDRPSTKGVVHHQGPKTIRGGLSGSGAESGSSDTKGVGSPKSMRGGGGGKHTSGSSGSSSRLNSSSKSKESGSGSGSDRARLVEGGGAGGDPSKVDDTGSFGKQASGFVSRLFHQK